MISNFTYAPISKLTAIDLIEEAKSLPDAECVSVTFLSETDNPYPQNADLLYSAEAGRAGIAWGADAVWTDASSIEDAIQRYISDRMVG